MDVAALALELATLGLLLASALLLRSILRPRAREAPWLGRLEREPVLVELGDGRTIAGLLADVNAQSVVLANARIPFAAAGGGAQPLDGELVIPRARVAWIQRGIQLDDSATIGPHREAA